MFLSQALSADRSCQRAVNAAAVKRLIGGLAPVSTHTGGYCRARARLPLPMLSGLTQHIGHALAAAAPAAWYWRGHPVRLVDGTTVAIPDTAANQAVYPPPRSQAPGLGFPLTRLVGLICLGNGALLEGAIGGYSGKGADEQTPCCAACSMRSNPGTYCWEMRITQASSCVCALKERGVEAVFEQQGARRRSTDFRRGTHLGARDHLTVLHKPKRKPDWMTLDQYAQAPDFLTVRELATGGKVLVTTLLCPKQTPKAALKALYRERRPRGA